MATTVEDAVLEVERVELEVEVDRVVLVVEVEVEETDVDEETTIDEVDEDGGVAVGKLEEELLLEGKDELDEDTDEEFDISR